MVTQSVSRLFEDDYSFLERERESCGVDLNDPSIPLDRISFSDSGQDTAGDRER